MAKSEKPEKPVTKIKSAYMNHYDAKQERENKRKKRLFQRLTIIGLAFLVAFGVMFTYHTKQRAQHADLEEQQEELTEEMDGLENTEEALQEEIDLLNDEDYILDIARTNYFLSKEGELIIQTEDQDERAY
ncbi:MAG TPA: septum formation initiator family protein [Pseudogracilibacillus sp.]|nr:septum formation initiator family protein [Pseudogracilibacillus sp.]